MNIQISIIHNRLTLNFFFLRLRLPNPWSLMAYFRIKQLKINGLQQFTVEIITTVWCMCSEENIYPQCMFWKSVSQSQIPGDGLRDVGDAWRHQEPCWLMPAEACARSSHFTETTARAVLLKKYLTRICIASPRHVIMKVSAVFKEDMMESSKP